MMRSFGVDCNVLLEEEITFDKYLYWEDFHVTLSLLTRGYPNLLSVVYCSDGVTNEEGGVSLYRNHDDLVRVRAAFLEEWGQWAQANDRKSAKNWKGTDAAFVPDLKIAWRKAAEYGAELVRSQDESAD
jgi:hypothetical protein